MLIYGNVFSIVYTSAKQYRKAAFRVNKMDALKIEVNFNDLVDGMFDCADVDCDEYNRSATPSMSFKDSLKTEIVRTISQSVMSSIKKECMVSAESLARDQAHKFIETELQGILLSMLRTGDIHTKYDGLKNFDELIEKK